MKYQTTIHHRLDEALEQEWRALWNRSLAAHPFNAPQWFRTCLQTYQYQHIEIVAIRDGDELVAIIPLVESSRFGPRALMFPGGKHIDMSCILLAKDDAKHHKYVVAALERVPSLYLQEISSSFAHAAPKQYVSQASSTSPYLVFGDDPFAHVSKSQMYKIKRKFTQSEHDLTLKTYLGDEQSLALAQNIEQKSAKKAAGTTMFTNPHDVEFYKNLCREFGQILRVDVLFFKDIPMIYSIGFVHNGIYYAINTAYDNDYRSIVPGKLLVYMLIQEFVKNGLYAFYFSRGVNALKAQFTDTSFVQYDVYRAQNVLVNVWWKQCNRAVTTIVNNALLYNAYKQLHLTLKPS